MAADDSRRLVIDLSVITEQSVTGESEHTLVGNCPTGKTEGVMEEMDVHVATSGPYNNEKANEKACI